MNRYQRGSLVLVLVLVLTVITGWQFKKLQEFDQIIPGPGVTEVRHLSDYFPELKGSYADTPIYVMEGQEPGGTVLLLGGTHSREAAGVMSAVLLVENAQVAKGRLLVIPRANNSGASYNHPLTGEPAYFTIPNKSGAERTFRLGNRFTNPVHQWPEVDYYYTVYKDYKLSGTEARNLNRSYPGDPNGTYTEKLAYGIMELIRKENVSVSYDFHEAGTQSRLVDMLVCNPKGLDVGAMTVLNLEMEDIEIKLEQSSKDFRGLSHREWGDHSQTYSFLMETPNPGQDGITRGYYEVLAADTPYPLESRVAKHLATFAGVVDSFNLLFADQMTVILDIPGYSDVIEAGLSPYLN